MTYDFAALDPAWQDLMILVDEQDRPVGEATKEQAHLKGLLHRAFSVVLCREGERGTEILLTRRAATKYHSPGLWANACCSHPRAGEKDLTAAACRRVHEELGCQADSLHEIGHFVYRAEVGNGLTEHEFDHVFLGNVQGQVRPDPAETDEIRWVPAHALLKELDEHNDRFAAWAPQVLRLAVSEIIRHEQN